MVDVDPATDLVEGSELANTPETTTSAYLEYQRELSFGTFFARGDVRYVDEQAGFSPTITNQNNIYLDSYTLVNLRAGIDFDSWGLEIFANNLTDELVPLGRETNRILSTSVGTIIGAPRVLGLTVRVDF